MMNIELGGPLTSGPLPLWYQMKERLRLVMTDGTLTPGDQLPTERDLITYFDVSRATVRAALQALVKEGRIEVRQGSGTFVIDRPLDQPAGRLAGYHDDMRLRGLVPAVITTNIGLVSAVPDVESRLGLQDGSRVLVIERQLLADGSPMGFHRSFLPEWVLGGGGLFAKSDLDSKSLYDLLEDRASARPFRAEQTISATGSTDGMAALLEVPEGAPVLLIERLSRDRAGRPVELATLWYRADRYRFRIELEGTEGAPELGLRP